MTLDKQSILAAWISLISNLLLTVLKIVVGLLFHSQVLVADGVHNAGDVIASGAALSSMRISKLPPDEDHPYGHGKAEVVGAGFVAVVLIMAALFIGYHAVLALFEPIHRAHVLALAAAFISLIWKQSLYVYTIRLGKTTNSKGLIATAHDHLADVYASIAAVVGIGLTLIGERYDMAMLSYGDPIAGLIVSALVLKLGYTMAREAVDILMEKNVAPELLADFVAVIRANPQVKRIDRVRAREHGRYLIVDARVSVNGDMSIQQGHNISRELKEAIIAGHPDVEEVLIHLNPWYEGELLVVTR